MQQPFDLPTMYETMAARPGRRRAGLAVLALGGFLLAPIAAAAAGDGAQHGDWELVCKEPAQPEAALPEGPQPAACRLQQAQAVNGGKDVVFLFNIVRQGRQHVAIVSTPLNVYLPTGLELRIDGGQPRRVAFETCNVSGCHAGFALNGQLLAALRKGKALVVGLKDTKATAIPVNVSLKGISAGIDALDAAAP